ncbi:nuclear segregation protein Bfr1 [Kwoniella mangroviensis CBS 10435]|uniref:Nuclear segregation protein Bfr1 n=1 Tax=Kwoniella mangroviensis CBS 10435 TaxID=1331196 RepID=A0A1B9J232_9TREE|nr:nuclear segregation protein Bfr1 [Kwoniella mangroviensis CBS 10435]OCF77817.1 nuclear segregation protein Bfr1 [Kwoniella mangroviensis CBS 8886]
MPPPTSSLKPTAAKTNGSSAPAAAPAKAAGGKSTTSTAGHLSKPDQSKYNAEQEELNKQIAEVKTKLDAIRSRISLTQAPQGGDRRSEIKAEMDSLRSEQAKFKGDRNKLFDEMKKYQESLAKKIKEVQGQKGKVSYRTTGEIDDRIASLEKQIESGSLKLVDEKKALAEITSLRRSRKVLETTGSVDDAIAADKAKIDELKKQLDDPEAKKVNERFDALKKEMDSLRAEGDKAYEERGKLFDERNKLSKDMDELYEKKRQSAQAHREANDKYYAKVQADRQARQERFKAEKAKEDAARRNEEITRLREEAKAPAFTSEIDDCQVLIGWFKGKYGSGEVPSTHAGSNTSEEKVLEGVKALEIRKVDSEDAFKGMTLKKKGDEEELGGFFGGGGKSKKNKKGGNNSKKSGTATPASEGTSTPTSGAGAVNLPMSLLSALLSLGIPPPSGKDDVQRTIDDLETKKAWFEANSAAKTKAEIERVEKLVAKLQKKNAGVLNDDDEEEKATTSGDEVPVEKGGSKEPLHTVAVAGEATGTEIVEDEGEQLPTNEDGNDPEVKKVDSALEELKEAEALQEA